MTRVKGFLTDLIPESLIPLSPSLLFIPTAPTTYGTYGTGLGVTQPIAADLSSSGTGFFSVDLLSTWETTPEIYYRLRIEWLDAAGGYTHVDFPDWKVRVPGDVDEVNIGRCIDAPANAALVWSGPTAPPDPSIGLWWLNTSTGDLFEWSN